jgi:hypothetical protein
MKTRTIKISAIVLVLSLLVVPTVGAATDVGFDVDCAGARGYGWVDADETVWWDLALWDPAGMQWYYLDGIVSGGDTGAPFEPVVEWPVPIVPGTEAGSSYYQVYIKGCLVDSGHFECPPCDQGCTPGYWKQPHHLDSWGPTGYVPDDYFNTVFVVDFFDPEFTLLEALKAKGGGVNALARHATAALLSAAHPGVDYPASVAKVLALVQDGDKDTLEGYNELGCPLN